MTSEDGDTFIVKAGPKHEILGTNSIGEPVYASPAIAGQRIFIRGEKNLYAIGKVTRRRPGGKSMFKTGLLSVLLMLTC